MAIRRFLPLIPDQRTRQRRRNRLRPELQALVAPIALYPDALVAQILAASTFPDQVAIAAYWMGQNKNLTGSALISVVSIKAIVGPGRESVNAISVGAGVTCRRI